MRSSDKARRLKKGFTQNQLEELAEVVLTALDASGWFLLKDFSSQIPADQLRAVYHQLNALVGKPIGHDRSGTIVWDIKARTPGKDANTVVTYSEHSHEADLHTDSQYSEYPEDFFSLLTLRRADCGGGISYLLSLKDIEAELSATPEGRSHREVLSTTNFPFIVPNVFRKRSGTEPEFTFGPILRPGEIRFRIDTIEKALAHNPDFCTVEQTGAFHYLKRLVRQSGHTRRFFLEGGDLIFINNKTMLHGRGSFTDPKRHLLRIRMVRHENCVGS